jgi:hypothetical protein
VKKDGNGAGSAEKIIANHEIEQRQYGSQPETLDVCQQLFA